MSTGTRLSRPKNWKSGSLIFDGSVIKALEISSASGLSHGPGANNNPKDIIYHEKIVFLLFIYPHPLQSSIVARNLERFILFPVNRIRWM